MSHRCSRDVPNQICVEKASLEALEEDKLDLKFNENLKLEDESSPGIATQKHSRDQRLSSNLVSC
jgi:signal recognition particle subunit SEC65